MAVTKRKYSHVSQSALRKMSCITSFVKPRSYRQIRLNSNSTQQASWVELSWVVTVYLARRALRTLVQTQMSCQKLANFLPVAKFLNISEYPQLNERMNECVKSDAITVKTVAGHWTKVTGCKCHLLVKMVDPTPKKARFTRLLANNWPNDIFDSEPKCMQPLPAHHCI